MPPRLKSTAVAAFIILGLYLTFARNYGADFYGSVGEHGIDVIQENLGEGVQEDVVPGGEAYSTKGLETQPPVPVATGKPALQPTVPNPDSWNTPTDEQGEPIIENEPGIHGDKEQLPTPTRSSKPLRPAYTDPHKVGGTTPASPAFTKAPMGGGKVVPGTTAHVDDGVTLQKQFEEESDDLESDASAEGIYGTTLQTLNDTGSHEGFKAAALSPTEFWSTYSDKRPYFYNPYPEYNSRSWKQHSRGMYKPCLGPKGEVADLKVYSGHPQVFAEPIMGSYNMIDIDSNLCFERETRLGPYGFIEGSSEEADSAEGESELDISDVKRRSEWDSIDWGLLQRQCVKKNANRYASVFQQQQIIDHVKGTATPPHYENSTANAKRIDTIQDEDYNEETKTGSPPSSPKGNGAGMKKGKPQFPPPKVKGGETKNGTPEVPPPKAAKVKGEVTEVDEEDQKPGHSKYKPPVVTTEEQESAILNYAMPSVDNEEVEEEEEEEEPPSSIEDEELEAQKQAAGDMTEEKSRTAVLIRTLAGQNFTANDKQNIRAMISELCLRSGGEYQVFLLVQVEDDGMSIWEDPKAYQDVIEVNIPEEFWNITILWNDAKMQELYPLIPEDINNVDQSQWLSVQKFAQDYPEFGFFWNWEYDSRYIGQYYDLLEKLQAFAKAQPRKYLWERNERYYIPSFHGPYPKFMKTIETLTGRDTIWGPMPNVLAPAGPPMRTMQPSEDRYFWGKGEAADYISLAPIFNPVNTRWEGRGDIWGYEGEATPRRASVGTTALCSKKLLHTMHLENLKGNHVSSEMTPSTVSLLHGLKAVYAPFPMFFDKPWSGKSLEKYFNPGPKGVSGSTKSSPFGQGQESRFQGSTWYSHADAPMRLYNNWLGMEDHDMGGPEWEKVNGRICLPPLLLRPIRDVINHGADYSSESEFPY